MTACTPVIGPPTPVDICQLADEFETCLSVYREKAPSRVLEIGTASGGTLYHWIQHAKPGTRIVTVDRPTPDYPLDRDRCAQWAIDARVDLHMVAGDSTDPDTVEKVWALGPYDWVFIDGDHRYAGAKADVDNYGGMIDTGGILGMHDIFLVRDYEDGTSAGVSDVWAKVRETGEWAVEIRHNPPQNAYGIGLMQVGEA